MSEVPLGGCLGLIPHGTIKINDSGMSDEEWSEDGGCFAMSCDVFCFFFNIEGVVIGWGGWEVVVVCEIGVKCCCLVLTIVISEHASAPGNCKTIHCSASESLLPPHCVVLKKNYNS